MIRLALDGLGGEFVAEQAPEAILAFLESTSDVAVGVATTSTQFEQLLAVLPEHLSPRCFLMECEGVIAFEDAPVKALKQNPKCSVVVAMESHGRGEVDAVLSFGHTGAAVVAAQWKTGLVEGVARPGLAAILPNRSGYGLLMDVGANLKPKPLTLLQYALMAEEYCRHALDVARPKVGLLNVGEEKGKGDECRQEAFELMSRSDLGFVGNVEGGQVFDGSVDAVICGGFEGNVVLKASEGLASMLMDSVKKISSEGEDASRTLGGRLGEALTTQLSRRHDPSSRGVSRLLGVRGAVLIGHGNAKAEAIKSGLFQAFKEVQSGLQPALIDRLRKHSHP